MAKVKVGNLAKNQSNASTSAIGSAGGMFGSGIYGLFGSTIVCKDSDNSYYCNFMKIVNVLIILFVLSILLYFVVMYMSVFLKHSKYSPVSVFNKK